LSRPSRSSGRASPRLTTATRAAERALPRSHPPLATRPVFGFLLGIERLNRCEPTAELPKRQTSVCAKKTQAVHSPHFSAYRPLELDEVLDAAAARHLPRPTHVLEVEEEELRVGPRGEPHQEVVGVGIAAVKAAVVEAAELACERNE